MSKSMDEALKRLAEKASTLNSRTDAANEALEKANRELSTMNLGLEVWLTGIALDETRADHELPAYVQLGFARVDGSWQLAIRSWVPELEGEFGGRLPLAKQGRALRIKASAHIRSLIEEITQQVDGLLEATSDARTKP